MNQLDEQTLITIYRETVEPLYRRVLAWTRGDQTLAEDTLQETYLRALDRWRSHGVPDQPMHWLITVARNLLISHWRRQGKKRAELPPELTSDPVDLEERERMVLVGWALSRLNHRAEALLRAFHFEERSTREIADDLGVSDRAVEGRLRRARRAMRSILKPLL